MNERIFMAASLQPPRWKPDSFSFTDRTHAGTEVAKALLKRGHLENPVLLGCPRGGLVVAKAVDDYLKSHKVLTSLGCIISRKIPKPDNP